MMTSVFLKSPLLTLVSPLVLSGLISSTRLVAVVVMMMMRMISDAVMFPPFFIFGYLMPRGSRLYMHAFLAHYVIELIAMIVF